MMTSQFHVNLRRKQVIIVAPARFLAVQLNDNLLFWTVPAKIIMERYGAQVLYFSQNLFQYDLKKQNLGPGQTTCRGDVHFGCGGVTL
ncbi:MAG: hypothetical protein KCHDKBKB_00409 [Elusimicrobia bacterium]|nr:hypothetical protein [Elusimicrobiota bacterium]